jgi:hypothetical protein
MIILLSIKVQLLHIFIFLLLESSLNTTDRTTQFFSLITSKMQGLSFFLFLVYLFLLLNRQLANAYDLFKFDSFGLLFFLFDLLVINVINDTFRLNTK